mmetsp:Transcript_32265/g.57036  ORF Transcript_32265/g.57036 Transcript_32265/m.57036 type:complete len:373 (+) Transcript_32265:92-1210(+)
MAVLQRTGANVLGASGPRSRPPSSQSGASFCSREPIDLGPPPPPTGRTGILHSTSAPTLTPDKFQTGKVPTLHNVRMGRAPGADQPESLPQAVWSDSCAHLGNESWPQNAVPLFIFSGRDRPRPGYRDEFRFTLREEKYVIFALRLRSGGGDKYMGGTVGLIHSPDKAEVMAGHEGQLVTIVDLVVNMDNSIIVSAIGDLPFTVMRAWMPRGHRGLQMALVDVHKVAPRIGSVLQVCSSEPGIELFAHLFRGMPTLAEVLAGNGPFTVFVPVNDAFDMSEEELLSNPGLEAVVRCHICPDSVKVEGMYAGRTLHALDGTLLTITFTQWPRGGPMVNGIPIEHMDLPCSNGVIHCIGGVLRPNPGRGRGRPQR